MAQGPQILMVVTSTGRIDAEHPTGLWLEEFALPFGAFTGMGYRLTVASPRGGEAPIDPRSVSNGDVEEDNPALAALEQTVPLEELNPYGFDAVFIPGGHGTMFDLPGSTPLRRVLETVDQKGGVIAALCHGPCALLGARRRDGEPLVAGRKVTAFTDSEERSVELDQRMPFLLETRLREQGADFLAAPDWSDHVVVDGKLVTGQNPQSSASVAEAVIELLGDRG